MERSTGVGWSPTSSSGPCSSPFLSLFYSRTHARTRARTGCPIDSVSPSPVVVSPSTGTHAYLASRWSSSLSVVARLLVIFSLVVSSSLAMPVYLARFWSSHRTYRPVHPSNHRCRRHRLWESCMYTKFHHPFILSLFHFHVQNLRWESNIGVPTHI
jgi:hypothetical protein